MEKNIDEAVKWLRKAAELGNQEAMLKLGTVLQQSDKSFSKIIDEYQSLIKERDLQIIQLQKSIESIRLQANKNIKISYMDGYNDAKAGKRNKYIKEEPKVVVKPALSFGNVKVGSIIKFGNYPQNTKDKKEPIEWRVLDIKDGKALLISKYALDCKNYNERREDITWEQCTLRKWLNSNFLNSAFDTTEKNLILLSKVTADKNPKHNTNQGNDTEDKVFLLSVKEAEQYFKSTEDRKCNPTKFAIANNAYKSDKGQCWWWLRSLGYISINATDVDLVGSVHFNGSYVLIGNDAVRPALWINLKS